jgi:murein DD-endopeptidase MepM/ murein hydrolase activator NlpD
MNERRKAWVLRAAMIAASAGLLSACQTTSPYSGEGDPSISGPKPQYPIHNAPEAPKPAPRPAPVEAAPAYTPPPYNPPSSAPITSQPLPPPTYTPPPEVKTPAAPPAPPAPPQYRTVAGGPVEDAEGPPKTYEVKAGDHLDAIGRELGMTRKELAEQNDLKEPYRLKPGQKLKGPATKGKAYVVQAGDTLSAISRRFTASTAVLADQNDMKTSDPLRPGKKLLLPKGYKDSGPGQVLVTPSASVAAAPPVVTPTPTPAAPKSAPTPATAAANGQAKPDQTVTAPTPDATAPATPNPVAQATPGGPCVSTQQLPSPLPPGFPTAAQLKDMGKGKFAWPVRGGKVLACFGPQPVRAIGPDQKAGVGVVNNGIDISANPNTAVRASAAGEVIHAEQVAGQGLTVIIRHPDGWITIYGNMSSISVPKRDVAVPLTDDKGKTVSLTKVSAGQEIGRSGGTATGQALVHFEVRYSKDASNIRPIDPELVLPPR